MYLVSRGKNGNSYSLNSLDSFVSLFFLHAQTTNSLWCCYTNLIRMLQSLSFTTSIYLYIHLMSLTLMLSRTFSFPRESNKQYSLYQCELFLLENPVWTITIWKHHLKNRALFFPTSKLYETEQRAHFSRENVFFSSCRLLI